MIGTEGREHGPCVMPCCTDEKSISVQLDPVERLQHFFSYSDVVPASVASPVATRCTDVVGRPISWPGLAGKLPAAKKARKVLRVWVR